ncbi:MAG: hypothetical protein Q9226_007706 [Calogaya cf. arnoldii]
MSSYSDKSKLLNLGRQPFIVFNILAIALLKNEWVFKTKLFTFKFEKLGTSYSFDYSTLIERYAEQQRFIDNRDALEDLYYLLYQRRQELTKHVQAGAKNEFWGEEIAILSAKIDDFIEEMEVIQEFLDEKLPQNCGPGGNWGLR